MPLSWNEIRSRSHEFSRRWVGETSERAEAQSFWQEFFNVFGIDRKRVAVFEKHVELSRKGEKLKHGRIDAFWKGMLLIEHKSAGQDLDRAFNQAIDYFEGIKERDLPRYILVSDFARFRLSDLETGTEIEFRLEDLPRRIKHFAFIAGYRTQEITVQNPAVNIKAAEQMGRLHDLLKKSGYTGHALEVLLVRMLFCLFADDTGIFQPAGAFRMWLDERTAPDGSDLGPQLAQLFQVLNTAEDKRPTSLDEQLRAFPYVNGKLFEEMLSIAAFDSAMRDSLLDCCALDWSSISPAIFGALFQSIMDDKARRNLGAHYTSEENILKLIKPLFLDELRAEFERVKSNRNRLFEFHKKLRGLTFFDPACGCGNFLVIAYRELRLLELDVLRTSLDVGQAHLDVHSLINIDVDQFYGIEIEEFPAQIAQVALWLIDHQMNTRISNEFGMYFARIPLKSTPHIHCDNALQIDWADVIVPERCSYVLGNPPFIGKKEQSPAQKSDMTAVTVGIKGAGVLDFVSAWYIKAAAYIRNTGIRCAFVSTNSITQGEQVGILWGWLRGQGIRTHFAHRTFQWSNEARGKAAVHCVIIGFGLSETDNKIIYEYADVRGEPHAVVTSNINPYLIDAPDLLLAKRFRPVGNVVHMNYGSMALDDGHLLFNEAEYRALLQAEPSAASLLRPFMGGEEFLNNGKRWCLWLKDVNPTLVRTLPQIVERIEKVKRYRQSSGRATTVKLASYATLFGEDRQPDSEYLLIPKVSSENRHYLPIGFMSPNVVANGSALIVPNAGKYEFGVLSSTIHMAWMRYTCGRLESRYQYSSSLVYNNFPWPENPSGRQRLTIEAAAQSVLDVRTQFPDASLADLYDPVTMPPGLVKAHQQLDAAVDTAYGRKSFRNDAERVAFLFELYQKYTSLLPVEKPKRGKKKSVAQTGDGTAASD